VVDAIVAAYVVYSVNNANYLQGARF
jgi:hypothetical protein